MADYFLPYQRLDNYTYDENQGVTSIKSSLKVLLHAGQNIQIAAPVAVTPVTFYISLQVVTDTNQLADYLWEGDVLIEIINGFLYDKSTTPAVNKIPIVRIAINQKLSFNNAAYFFVEAEVVKPDSSSGGIVSNTVSSSDKIIID